MFTCVVCHGTTHRPYHTKKNFDIFVCDDCDTLRIHPLPTKEQLDRAYGAGYFTGDAACDGYMDYEFEKEVTRRTFEEHLDQIEKHQPPGELFEVGAATGYFLSLARERGWRVAGVDYSSYAAARAEENGIPVQAGGVETLAPHESRYDVIALFDVIEHLLYPEEELAQMVRALKPGGLLVFATPDRSSMFARLTGRFWHAIVPPQHVFLFGSKTIDQLLQRHGLTVLEKSRPGKWFTVQYLFRVLYTWLGWRPLYVIAQRIADTRLGRLSFPLNLRDTMFVVARKRPLANEENTVVP